MCCQKCLTVKRVCLETASINSLSLTPSSTCRHQHKQEFKEAFSAQTSVRQHTFGFYRPLLKRFVLCDSRGYQITRELFDVFIKEARDSHVFCPPHILLLLLHSLWVFSVSYKIAAISSSKIQYFFSVCLRRASGVWMGRGGREDSRALESKETRCRVQRG